MQGWYYVESLTEHWHDRVQTESQIATVDSCFDLIGSLQHGVASCEVCSWLTDIHRPTKCRWWWPRMKLKSKFLPIWNFCQIWHWPIGRNLDLSFIWGYHHLHLVDDQSTSRLCWPSFPQKNYARSKHWLVQPLYFSSTRPRGRPCQFLLITWLTTIDCVGVG